MGNHYFLYILIILLAYQCKVSDYASDSTPVEHAIWDSLVSTHVTKDGWVDYKAFMADTLRLNRYIDLLSSAHPNDENWNREERLAYWINAYNAFTVKLILDHYPVESIKDIKRGIPFVNTVWDIKFIQIEDRTYDLNQIEHGILRPKFEEPRIHFAINCASYSCPVLRNEAYVADKLEGQLEDATRNFLNDPRRNKITREKLQLSKIFSWFKSDFTKEGSLKEFIDPYVEMAIDENAKIDYLDYNWRLNDN